MEAAYKNTQAIKTPALTVAGVETHANRGSGSDP